MKLSFFLKCLKTFLKAFIFVITLALAGLFFFDGYFLASWYPSFMDLRFGAIMMVLSGLLAFLSLLIFKRKNFSSIVLILVIVLLDYGTFVYDEGTQHELTEFTILYVVSVIVLYLISKLIEKQI